MKIASIESTIEAPIIATEPATDPATPASGPGAGANEGLRSWAEATAANTMTKPKNNFIVVADDDAIVIVKLFNREEKMESVIKMVPKFSGGVDDDGGTGRGTKPI